MNAQEFIKCAYCKRSNIAKVKNSTGSKFRCRDCKRLFSSFTNFHNKMYPTKKKINASLNAPDFIRCIECKSNNIALAVQKKGEKAYRGYRCRTCGKGFSSKKLMENNNE